MTRYQGSCHCGAVQFCIEAEINELIACDCSLCRKKNALMATVSYAALKIHRGREWLSLYQWNTGKAEHYFCSKCGIYTFNRRRMNSDLYSVNAYCLDGLDLATLPVRQVAGKNRP
jgi:hypothetical protein